MEIAQTLYFITGFMRDPSPLAHPLQEFQDPDQGEMMEAQLHQDQQDHKLQALLQDPPHQEEVEEEALLHKDQQDHRHQEPPQR